MNIYVGNLAYAVTEEEVRQAFEAFGQVASVMILRGKLTGASKGFGFVDMPTQAEAQSAIAGLNGQELHGRRLTVNAARPRPESGRDRRR